MSAIKIIIILLVLSPIMMDRDSYILLFFSSALLKIYEALHVQLHTFNILIARPPCEVSRYLVCMSLPVSYIVSITLSKLT